MENYTITDLAIKIEQIQFINMLSLFLNIVVLILFLFLMINEYLESSR